MNKFLIQIFNPIILSDNEKNIMSINLGHELTNRNKFLISYKNWHSLTNKNSQWKKFVWKISNV